MDIVESELVHRIKVVQRRRERDPLILLDGKGNKYDGLITHIDKRSVQISFGDPQPAGGELKIPITVAQSIVKGERFDWCLEKLTELGAAAVVPLVSQRNVVRWSAAEDERADRPASKMKRWNNLLREAAEQSERAIIPEIAIPVECSDYLSGSTCGGNEYWRYICVERSNAPLLIDEIKGRLSSTSGTAPYAISVVIGPEGGLTEDELETARTHGWRAVSLGTRVLRSETAGMCAMAQIASLLDY